MFPTLSRSHTKYLLSLNQKDSVLLLQKGKEIELLGIHLSRYLAVEQNKTKKYLYAAMCVALCGLYDLMKNRESMKE